MRALVRQLNQLPEVGLAYRDLAVTDPSHDSDDTLAVVQEYLDRAPVGIDVEGAAGEGHSVAIR